MQGSRERIRRILNGQKADRVAMYDLLRNDAVIEHFAGVRLGFDNAAEAVYAAHREAVDATRPKMRLPQPEREERLPDGRVSVQRRWTAWISPRQYGSQEDYVRSKRQEMAGRQEYSEQDQQELNAWIESHVDMQDRLGERCYLFWHSMGSPGLMGMYHQIGLEEFCYLMYDRPEIIREQLDFETAKAVQKIERIPASTPIDAVFLGEDIAHKTGLIFPLSWLRENLLPHLHQIIEAYHNRGVKVNFHSDGDINEILHDLVEAGIDVLNPIEVAAGMDIAEIHRRYPHLILTGGIDTNTLLPFGTVDQVKDAVRKAIDDAGGRIMIGSSSELHDSVPLVNFLAMREAVLDYRL